MNTLLGNGITHDVAQMLLPKNDEQGYCIRVSDGVSGMSVTALAEFCGTEQPVITNLLNRIRDANPISNDLAESLKPLAGKDWRLISNQDTAFIVDEVCHAVLEYYVFSARKYKGKQIAIANYQTIAKAGLRVFIWSQTGYHPMNEALTARVTELEQKLATILDAIANLTESFNKISRALPTKADYMPPGWNPHNWERLSLEEKRHFRYLWKKRGFIPSDQGEDLKALPSAEIQAFKQQQKSEVHAIVGQVSEDEKQRIQALKQRMLARLSQEEAN